MAPYNLPVSSLPTKLDTMRLGLAALVSVSMAAGIFAAGCSSGECLPEPNQDATPPRLLVTVAVSSPSGAARSVTHEAGETTREIEVGVGSEVVVTYIASDSSGLRSLAPGVTIQHTVGVGVERRYVEIDPVEARCPRLELSYRHEVTGGSSPRSVIVTAVAENWVGRRVALDPLAIRYR